MCKLWQGQALVQQSQRQRRQRSSKNHGIAQPCARMEWCGRWTSGGANLASQSSMRAMMEPRAAASDLVQTKRLKNVKKNTQELSMVIFGRWLSISSEHSLVMLVGRLMLEETGTLWYLVQNVVTACTKLAFLATLWFTNWSDTNIFRVLPDMFVHKYPRIGEAANSNGWLY